MRVIALVLLGVAALFLAGFVRANEQVYGLGVGVAFGITYAIAGFGLFALLAAAVALGIRLGRD